MTLPRVEARRETTRGLRRHEAERSQVPSAFTHTGESLSIYHCPHLVVVYLIVVWLGGAAMAGHVAMAKGFGFLSAAAWFFGALALSPVVALLGLAAMPHRVERIATARPDDVRTLAALAIPVGLLIAGAAPFKAPWYGVMIGSGLVLLSLLVLFRAVPGRALTTTAAGMMTAAARGARCTSGGAEP